VHSVKPVAIAKPAAAKAVTPVTRAVPTAKKAAPVSKVIKTAAQVWSKPLDPRKIKVRVNGRMLANGGSGDPMSGCSSWGWTTCIPLNEFVMENECNDPDGDGPLPGETVFLEGHGAIWIKMGTVGGKEVFRSRSFFSGFTNMPTPSGTSYRGKDVQNDTVITYTTAATPTTFSSTEEWQELIVTAAGPPGTPFAPVSMWQYTRLVVGVDRYGVPFVDMKNYLVCKKFQKSRHDNDHRGDDRQCDSSHHGHSDYHGYNNDDNEWNDD